MPTLFEILKQKLAKPVSEETKVFNPLNLKPHNSLKINEMDLSKLMFSVSDIRELTVKSNAKVKMADYNLLARPFDSDDVTVRLRVAPNKGEFSASLLMLYDEFAFSQEFRDILNERSMNAEDMEFFRPNDCVEPHVLKVKTLSDTNNDKIVDGTEVTESVVELWDFSKKAERDGVECSEFLFVEMSQESGWFKLWRGFELSLEQVEVY